MAGQLEGVVGLLLGRIDPADAAEAASRTRATSAACGDSGPEASARTPSGQPR